MFPVVVISYKRRPHRPLILRVESDGPADLIMFAMGFLGPEKYAPTEIGELT